MAKTYEEVHTAQSKLVTDDDSLDMVCGEESYGGYTITIYDVSSGQVVEQYYFKEKEK